RELVAHQALHLAQPLARGLVVRLHVERLAVLAQRALEVGLIEQRVALLDVLLAQERALLAQALRALAGLTDVGLLRTRLLRGGLLRGGLLPGGLRFRRGRGPSLRGRRVVHFLSVLRSRFRRGAAARDERGHEQARDEERARSHGSLGDLPSGEDPRPRERGGPRLHRMAMRAGGGAGLGARDEAGFASRAAGAPPRGRRPG